VEAIEKTKNAFGILRLKTDAVIAHADNLLVSLDMTGDRDRRADIGSWSDTERSAIPAGNCSASAVRE
jgi:hypothetical protein